MPVAKRDIWWWNAAVDSAVKEKRRCWITWKNGGSKEEYQKAKCLVKHAVNLAKSQAKQEVPKDTSPSNSDLFTSHMRHKYLGVQGKRPVCSDDGELCLDDRAKRAARKDHYERLSNVEFNWDLDSPTEVYPVEGSAPHFPLKLVIMAKVMKCGKAAGTSLIVAVILIALKWPSRSVI